MKQFKLILITLIMITSISCTKKGDDPQPKIEEPYIFKATVDNTDWETKDTKTISSQKGSILTFFINSRTDSPIERNISIIIDSIGVGKYDLNKQDLLIYTEGNNTDFYSYEGYIQLDKVSSNLVEGSFECKAKNIYEEVKHIKGVFISPVK